MVLYQYARCVCAEVGQQGFRAGGVSCVREGFQVKEVAERSLGTSSCGAARHMLIRGEACSKTRERHCHSPIVSPDDLVAFRLG